MLFESCNIVLIEGYIERTGLKIEAWRRDLGTNLLAHERDDIEAVVTEDSIDLDKPVLPRGDIESIADYILNHPIAAGPLSPVRIR